MLSFRSGLLVGAAFIAMAGSAQAQSAPAPAAPPAKEDKDKSATVEGVEIKAAPSEVRTSIDSTS